MKKLFTSFILLMAGVMAVHAQSLYVGGKSIDLTSSATYTGGGITSGSAYYDAGSKTLTLKNVVLSGTLYGNNLGTLNISLEGDCKITPPSNDFIRFDDTDVLIQGAHNKFTIDYSANTRTDYCAFDIEGGYLQIWNTIIDFNGGAGEGIYGSASTGQLQMIRVYGTIKGDAGAIRPFKSIKITDDCQIFTEGATFSSGVGVVDGSGSLLSTVEIRPNLMVGKMIMRTSADTWTEGTASWNGSTKTLTLSAGFSATEGYPAIANFGVDGLVIQTDAAREIKATSANAVEIYKPTTFKGSGKLTVTANSSGKTAIYPRNSEAAITFDGCDVEASGEYGIDGSNGKLAPLTFKNAHVKVTGTTSAMGRISAVTFDGCDVATPADVYFKNDGFYKDGGSSFYAGTIEIKKATATYNVAILGKKINDVNASHFHVDGLTSGKITYDNSAKKLTLDNVTLTAPEGVESKGIESNNQAVKTITLTGDNTVTTKGTAFLLYGDCTIEGSGSLIATSTEGNGISMNQYSNNCTLTLNVDNKVKFLGGLRGIWGHDGYTSDLVLKKAGDKSDYYFQGNSYGAVYEVSDLKLTDMDFWSGSDGTPGCYFDNGYVCQNGGAWVKGDNVVNFYRLVSSDRYGFKVGGVEVTRLNMQGIGLKYITAGGGKAVTYDNDSKTLTLNGATIEMGNDGLNAIDNYSGTGVDGLTINVTGNNTINSENTSWSCLNLWHNTTITGSGKLNLTGANGGINVNKGAMLTLRDVNLDVARNIRAASDGGNLTVSLPNPGKKISVAGSVYDFTALTLSDGAKILEPEGGYYDTSNKYVATSGGSRATGVVFSDKTGTGIMGIEMDQNAEVEDIFDAQGRQIDELQQGVNILRMSDGTTKKVIKK